jgi:hypothetical protein
MRRAPNDMLRISRRTLIAGGVAAVFGGPALVAKEIAVGRIEAAAGTAVAEALSVSRLLSPGSDVFAGDLVVTAEQSHVGMKLDTATSVSLGAETRFRIERFAINAGAFELVQGAVLIDQLDDHRPEARSELATQLRSHFARIAARGARFFVGSSYGVFGVFVIRGEVVVTAGGETVALSSGQGSEIRKPGQHASLPRRWSVDRVGAALAAVAHVQG